MSISTVFLLLIIYTFGNAWAKFLPKQSWVENTRFERLSPVLYFINPGPFGLKEVRRTRCYPEGSTADILVHIACYRLSCGVYRCWRKLCRAEFCGSKGWFTSIATAVSR